MHALPTWFLVFGLIFPRMALVAALLAHAMPWNEVSGLWKVIGWLVSPRLLIAYLIYENQGSSLWVLAYVLSAIAAAAVVLVRKRTWSTLEDDQQKERPDLLHSGSSHLLQLP